MPIYGRALPQDASPPDSQVFDVVARLPARPLTTPEIVFHAVPEIQRKEAAPPMIVDPVHGEDAIPVAVCRVLLSVPVPEMAVNHVDAMIVLVPSVLIP